MVDKETQKKDEPLTQEELDKLDAELLQIETLYRSRCITPPKGSNVTVREIKKDE